MKKIQFTLTVILFSLSLSAQVPAGFSYQAVVRNTEGEIIAHQDVNFKFTILQNSTSGNEIYSETQSARTNEFGLANLIIGDGTVVSGEFNPSLWGGNIHFLKVEIDPANGNSFNSLGTTQLVAVPYAFHAQTVAEVNDADADPENELQELYISENELGLTRSETTVLLPSSSGGDDWGEQTVESDETLDGNGTNALPLKIARQSATTGQALKWNGTSWAPADDATGEGGLTLPYTGNGTSDSPLFNIVNYGTSGAISTLSEGNYGIWGESNNPSGIGVHGINKTSEGITFGIKGDVWSASGYSGHFQGGRFYIEGNTGIGTATPSAKLEVAGQVKITGGDPGSGKVLTSDDAGLASWQPAASGLWQKNGGDIFYNAGRVGIGLNNPAGVLEIYGNSVDSYPHIYLSETDGFARISFRTMLAASKHWVVAAHTNASDNISQWNLNYNDGTTGKNVFSAYGDSRIAFYGNVGIGTISPNFKLDVAGQLNLNKGITNDQAIYVNGSEALFWNGTYFSWGYGADYNYFADRVTIGDPADHSSYMLYVKGNAYSTGTWNSSDVRFKKNIAPIKRSLERVLNVRGASFEFRRNTFRDYRFAEGFQLGLIAQELEKEFPELVKKERDGYKSVNYMGMIPVLLEAIKEQHRLIEALKSKNGRLEVENDKINARLAKIENFLNLSARGKK